MHNRAKSNWGGYSEGGAIDGAFNGEPYLMANRLIGLTTSNQTSYTGTARSQYVANSRLTVEPSSAALKLTAGRTQILVNGFYAAADTRNGTISGTTSISGSTLIGVTQYAISGTVNNDTGAISVTFSPALPNNTQVVAEVVVDYERDPDKAPVFGFEVEAYSYHAAGMRAITELTIDSQSQVRNEMNLDPASNSLFSLRTQLTNEQHYHALQLGYMPSFLFKITSLYKTNTLFSNSLAP